MWNPSSPTIRAFPTMGNPSYFPLFHVSNFSAWDCNVPQNRGGTARPRSSSTMTTEVAITSGVAPLTFDLTSTFSSSFSMNEQQQQMHATNDEIREVESQERAHQASRLFLQCRNNQWSQVLKAVTLNPQIALMPLTMDNHISTTIVHQAITSKGNTRDRAQVISTILTNTPAAATIKNGYGSLPLHVICQRNTKMDSRTKESLIFQMVNAYKEALVEPGGVGKRTPLHIIFTGKFWSTSEWSRRERASSHRTP